MSLLICCCFLRTPLGKDLNLRRSLTNRLKECEYDCDKDSDCNKDLVCAEGHKSELQKAGLDYRKAYCSKNHKSGNARTHDTYEVCYDPKKVVAKPKLKECEYDCDSDSDCESGYYCAEKHRSELSKKGWDSRRAYCPKKSGMPRHSEVCYNPKHK